MQIFSKIKPKSEFDSKNDNVVWSNDYLSLIEFEDWTFIKESDFVVCIIYLIEENKFILRHEYIPTFKYVEGQEYHLTVLSGGIQKGESPQKALLREIEEEAGIVIRPDFKIEFQKPLFISKGNSSKYHPAIISLTERDYHEIIPTGDGSRSEKLSQTAKLDMKYLNSVNASDTITELMLEKLKNFLNM